MICRSNNAGPIGPIGRNIDSDEAAWGRIIDVNVKGGYHGLRHAIPVRADQGHGTIVNISSGAANSLLEAWSHYCGSRAAVLRLSGIAQKETADTCVRVVGLSPGTVATKMQDQIRNSGINLVSQIPWDNHISPDWVARAIAYSRSNCGRIYVQRGPFGDHVRLLLSGAAWASSPTRFAAKGGMCAPMIVEVDSHSDA